MDSVPSLFQLNPERFETTSILKPLASASRALAELKGIAASIPNQDILIRALGLQEAKDSSEIENIVTTHDELYKNDLFGDETPSNLAAKEVQRYRQALLAGWDAVHARGILSLNQILEIQAVLEPNKPGLRRLPGTTLQDGEGQVVYTPPQHPDRIVELMGELERFLNDSDIFTADPLVKMALAHHQFESIHPFYNGNGRTGRIVNVLYLVQQGLLDAPVLYLSRSIVRTKGEYYRHLQAVRDRDAWEDWVIYLLECVEATSQDAIATVRDLREALFVAKHKIREAHRFYSQDLVNHLFAYPYTKIEFFQKALGISRLTAAKYLDALVQDGILEKRRAGRSNYYANLALQKILTGSDKA